MDSSFSISDGVPEEADGDEEYLEDEDEDLPVAERIDFADHIVVTQAGKFARLFVHISSHSIIHGINTDIMSFFSVNSARA